MESPRQQVNELEAKNKSELKRILEGELDGEYTRDITNSLRNDFMRACCVRIAPNERPLERVREHPNYEGGWSEKKSLATALRMLLTERVDHPSFEGITSLTKTVLAEIIVAIREADDAEAARR